jgi:ribose transport system ATP-binding protein
MKNISKKYPGVLALDKVSFEVEQGEVHALVGENGAGKSTLMKILTGVRIPDQGEIVYRNESIKIHNPRDARNLGISIIYQEFNLLPHLTVAQNIFIGREPRKKPSFLLDEKELNRRAQEILDSLHLYIKPTEKIANLTVACQQMVEIVKALSVKSEILVMDEPTAALTEHEIEELFRVILKLKAQGVGIIYISHRLEELEHIADRVTVMRDGRYIDTVKYAETDINQLITMMVGRSITEIFPVRKAKIGNVALRVENLTEKKKLKDISFELHSGEVLGVAGLMGAGRTEMARAIFGADPVDSGNVYIHGKGIRINSPHQAIEHGIGYLTEDRKKDGIALGLSVENNILLASIPQFTNRFGLVQEGRTEKKANNLVSALKIKTPSLEQKAEFLSGGNQQKLIIARWLCRNSRVLIFDEPTRGIDVGAKLEIYELINQLTEEGVAIIMISSELPEILGMSDRILVMHAGRIAGVLSRSEATQEKIIYLATGGK